MNTINKVGVRIAGITLGLVIVLFGLWKGASYLFTSIPNSPQLTPTPSPSQLVLAPTPVGTVPPQLQQQISPYTESVEKSLGTYTKKYLATLPPEAARSQVLDQKTLEKFIEDNKGPLLPQLPEGTIKTSTSSGKSAIQNYLDSISPTHNTKIQTVTGDMITTALEKQMSEEDVQALGPIRASVEKNFETFRSVTVPKETLGLHTKLLQVTKSMIDNIALLQSMQQDFIGGLIGHKKITELDSVFNDISNQILALEKKYNLK